MLGKNYKSFSDMVKEGKKPVIMQVVPALNSGGVEQGVIDVNKAIVKAGGVSIIVASGGKRVSEVTRAGGIYIEMPVHSKNPITMYRNVKRLRKIINEYKVDLVHACSRAPAWSAKPAVKGTKAKYLTSCHSIHHIDFPLKRWYNSSVLKGELVIAVSYALEAHLIKEYKVDKSKMRVIQRGFSPESLSPDVVSQQRVVALLNKWRLPEDEMIILYPARVSPTKGHKILIDAMAKLGRKDIFCVIAGVTEGYESYVAELEQYIDSKGLGSQIRIVGLCTDMPAAYKMSNAVTCPSVLPEGFGRIAIEAMAMGKPFVGTNTGGYTETIKNGETGWLVEPNDVDALAEAIEKALAMDQKQRDVFAKKVIKYALENFTNELMCAKTLDVYAELINRK